MSDLFVYTTPLDPLAQPLVQELTHEYDSRYGEFYQQDGSPREMEKYPPQLFAPAQGGNFVLLLRRGQAVAGGAFKRYDDDTAELKRMWTHSQWRRQGLACKVMAELEAQVQRQGYRRIYLTTGFRQPEAVGLYQGLGYSALFDVAAPAGTYRSLPFEKRLSPEVPSLADAPHFLASRAQHLFVQPAGLLGSVHGPAPEASAAHAQAA
ncbi:acetyltransferase (GNAT) family protein [Acidovorax sp. 56]|uniref:GNAT family N-acetyltransferase n=1 Tax=Acidovorax sp. 56 TaxID=2035205 RepID=UPI000C167585|nr:GNAT family N-acetyltransferase [Acidovorax sp. 56]PIF25518.1 acetyltransferase (GNAT) family protein [Acidovorax sp. 56]